MDTDADNEHGVLCEKIINDIHAVFVKDHDLSTFEIIPTILNQNKSPVIHVEHNLGLESWCAKHIYDHSHKTIIAFRRHQQQHQRFLHNSDTIIKYLNVALLINPDVASFWNTRRQLVQNDRLDMIQEFKFSALVLTKKPKSNEAFAYRRWLFSFQSAESIDWLNEIGICERCADRSSGNYHAWSHRQWVLQNAPDLIRSELMRSEKFMRKHISDYSSYHYRQFVISRAYGMCYFEPCELGRLTHLKALISYYRLAYARTTDDVLHTLLPSIDFKAVGEQRLSSFLFCCNIAAYDMRLCEEQKNLYGVRESFELHRRASLKFIVEHTVRLLLGDTAPLFMQPTTPAEAEQFNTQLRQFNYATNPFLKALRRHESVLEENRQWCAIFFGFDTKMTTAATSEMSLSSSSSCSSVSSVSSATCSSSKVT